jgi:antagonist of KipI
MDPFALRLANLLVGNAEGAAALEFALAGPELEFSAEAIVAAGGGDFGALPLWRPVGVSAGTRLDLGPARSGCHGYLAVAGGIDVPPVLGSRSTLLSAGLGGFCGRALQKGDLLRAAGGERRLVGLWHADTRILPPYSAAPTVRVLPGAHAGQFDGKLLSSEFTVTARSDRMGVRLAGPPLARNTEIELLSSGVAPGTVQVPPDGQPIILMADAQTIGGYPQVANVISVDLPLIAQLRPGDTVRFREATLAEAQDLVLARERHLAVLRYGLAQKYR